MQAAIKEAVIQMGPKAGKAIMDSISQARQELLVLSPLLTATQLKLLIKMHEQGVKVNLVTTISGQNIGNVDGYDYRRELIKQHKYHDKHAAQKKESLKGYISFLFFALAAFIIIGVLAYFYYHPYAWIVLAALALVSLFLLLVCSAEVARTSVCRYTYKTIFPIRVFIDPCNQKIRNASRHFIHAKLYIIDQAIAYLGSADLTCSSLESNYESVVRTEDPTAIQELQAEVQKLLGSAQDAFDFVDVEEWGRMIYSEPKA